MEDSKKEIVEERVKPTVIRRRAKETVAVAEASQDSQEKAAKAAPSPSAVAPTSIPFVAQTPTAKPAEISPRETQNILPAGQEPGAREKEEKTKKVARRKKSRAEMELEDIQRAGGLKRYAEQTVIGEPEVPGPETPGQETPEWEPSVERVFEPGLAKGKKKRVLRREFKKTAITETKAIKKVIRMEKGMNVSELSQRMGVKISEIIKKLMNLGLMVTANQNLDVDTATLVAHDYGFEVQETAFKEEAVFKIAEESKGGDWRPRAPVVTVMGHVDHGKTSILDFLRKTKVAEGEAGGITQHIGAYQVSLPKGTITFIDTPGHAAFTKMRSRGAQVTDIVVLVVAADDGIMPQTIEAIDHAKAAGVPIVVAVNKIDKPQSDPEKVKRSLTEHGLVPEEWGGDVICVPTSAKSGQGMDQLLEMILLTAEVKELKGDFSGSAQGVLIEAKLDRGRGPVATVLVKSGVMRAGDYVVCGLSFGRIRAMVQADGSFVEEAIPSQPVEILGLEITPEAGDPLVVVESERDAKHIVQERQAKERSQKLSRSVKLSLEELQTQIAKGSVHELSLVIKADMAGSVEALAESLVNLSTEKVTVKILHQGTGGITENDVMLARASNAVILGFHVIAESQARKLAEQEGIEIRIHSIIYEVIDDVKKAMLGLLKPKITEKFVGRAQVKQVFKISKVGAIAGCVVTEGVIRRSAKIRLSRDGTIIFEGKIASLKRIKDDAREVAAGLECGIGIENFNDVKEGDAIDAFVLEETPDVL